MMKKKDSQKGFAMLFTVLIVSIILSISIGISNITFKQNILSSIAKDSQIAFFTADSGIECGLIHDLNTSQFAKGVTSVPSTISCGDMTFDYDASASFQDNFVYVEDVSNQNNPCRVIIFDKTDASINSVKSRGYNICKQTPRQVERALEARFQNQDPETIIKEKLTEILALGETYKTTNNGTYANICTVNGDSNVLAIQGAMDYIKSTGASVKCYVRGQSSSIDWGVGVIQHDSKMYTAGPVEGIMKIDNVDNGGPRIWNSASGSCIAYGGSLMGIGSLKSLRLANNAALPNTANAYYWSNTPYSAQRIAMAMYSGAESGYPVNTSNRVRCGVSL